MSEVFSSKIKYPLIYALYLISVWTVFRLSGVVLPQEVDEFIVKPLVWLGPLFFILKKEGVGLKSLGITRENLFPGVYLAVLLGFIFAVEAILVNYIKYGTISFGANLGEKSVLYLLFLSLGTAVTEELAFRGYIFNRFWKFFKNEIFANLLTSILWVIIHIPASFAVLGYGVNDAISFWFLALLYSVGACFIFSRTRNIFSAILLFVLWEFPIIMFR